MRGKPKRGKQAKRRQWRSKRACFEDGPRFSGTKCTETGWADGVFLFRAGRKNFRHAKKGTADFRCSFCIYASKTISRVLYLTVIYLDVPLPVRSSHPGSGRASLGTRSPCSHTGVAPDRVYSDGCFDAPSGELLPRLSTLTTSSQASYPSPRRDTARLTHFAVPPFP